MRRPALAPVLLAGGCGQGGATPVPGDRAGDVDETALGPDTDGAPTDDSDPVVEPERPGVAGVLRDEAGRPLAATTVQACTPALCLSGASDAGGRFAFPMRPPVQTALETLDGSWASPRRAVLIVPFEVTREARVDLGDVYVPELPEGGNRAPDVAGGDAGVRGRAGAAIGHRGSQRIKVTRDPCYTGPVKRCPWPT